MHDPASRTASPSGELCAQDDAVWSFVRQLISDVEREQQQEAFTQRLVAWHLGVRAFRRAEDEQMHLQVPSAVARRFHKVCLSSLLSMGHALVLASKAFTPEELSRFNVTHEAIEAYVDDLEESQREWSHDLAPERVAEVQRAIFGAAP